MYKRIRQIISLLMVLVFAFQSGAIEVIAAGENLTVNSASLNVFDKEKLQFYLRNAMIKRLLAGNITNPSVNKVKEFYPGHLPNAEDIKGKSITSLVPQKLQKIEPEFESIKKSAPKRLIVKYKGVKSIQDIKNKISKNSKLSGFDVKGSSSKSKLHILEAKCDEDLKATQDELKKDPDVEYVEEDKQLTPLDEPSDPDFSQEWWLKNSGQAINGQAGTAGVDINALGAWAKTKGSPEVVVAVTDTGVDIGNDDLKDNSYINKDEIPGDGLDNDGDGFIDNVSGFDFANNDSTVFDSAQDDKHGTHVAGTLAASENNIGICGVAPKIRILPLKFISGGIGYTSGLLQAIDYCKQKDIRIMNCSFGSTEFSQALKDAMADSRILFLCAAGNTGSSTCIYPAGFNLPNVVSVAAVDNKGCLAPFSNFGGNVSVAAPGVDILSDLPGNNYGLMSGTSMATPIVSGIAALVASSNPNLTANEIADRIKRNVVKSDKLAGKVSSGGIVNALAAIEDSYQGTSQNTGTSVGTTNVSVIQNNDQNKDVSNDIVAIKDYKPGNKVLKPLVAADTPEGTPKSVSDSVYLGLDSVRGDLSQQSISTQSYIMETEPDDLSSKAMPVGMGTVYGTISGSTDRGWYAVYLNANSQYTFKLKGIPAGNDFGLDVFDSGLSSVGGSYNNSNADETVTVNTTTAGYYYINISPYIFKTGETTQSYQLMIYPSTLKPDQYEPNDSMGTATVVSNDAIYNGTISTNTDDDWYAIDAAKAGKLTVSLKGIPSGCDYDMAVYDSSCVCIGGSYSSGNADEKASILIGSPGRYYIRIYSFSGCNADNAYSLRAAVTTPDSFEANDCMADAKDIQPGAAISGTIDSSMDVDWYRMNISGSQVYRIALQHIPSGCDYDLYLFDSNGNCIGGSCFGGNADELVSTSLAQGNYYVKVVPYTGSSEVGQYQLSVSGNSSLEVSMAYMKGSAGGMIEVPVSISNLPSTGICGFNFTVNYDKNALTYTGFTAGTLISGPDADLEVNEGDCGINVLFVDDSAEFNKPLTSAGEVIKLQFKVKDGLPDGAYVLRYSDGWGFTSIEGDDTVGIEAVFKPGLVTTGGYSAYTDVPFTQPNMGVMDTTFYYGDVNKDGKINSTDYSLLKRHILGIGSIDLTTEEDTKKRSDVNGDGNINSTDYSLFKRYILGLIIAFPVEGIVIKSPENGSMVNIGTTVNITAGWAGCDHVDIFVKMPDDKENTDFVKIGIITGAYGTVSYKPSSLGCYSLLAKGYCTDGKTMEVKQNFDVVPAKPTDPSVIKGPTTFTTDYQLKHDEVYDSIILSGGTLDLNGCNLWVNKDLMQPGGTLKINGGRLYVSGNYKIQDESGTNPTYSKGALCMTNTADYVQVGESFVDWELFDNVNNEYNNLSAGILQVKGDFTQKNSNCNTDNFCPSGKHKVVLRGTKLQTVNFENSETSYFNILEINNYSQSGVSFTSGLNANKFMKNDCYVSFTSTSSKGWVLIGDETLNNSLTFKGGMIDLNGHTLTVNGDILQPGGTLRINGGRLYVSGNYRIQDERGSYSGGTLCMTNTADYVQVGESFVDDEFLNNLYISERGFLVGGDNVVVYSMKSKKIFQKKSQKYQRVKLTLDSKGYTVSNTADGESELGFSADCSGEAFNLNVDVDIAECVENKELGLELTIVNDSGRDVNIGLKDKTGKVRVVDRSGNSIYVSSDKEKVYVNSKYSNLSAGILEVKGDFTHTQFGDFLPSGTHKVVLSGTTLQNISFKDQVNSRFNILILTKPLNSSNYNFNNQTPWTTKLQTIDDTTPPAAPTGLTKTAATDNSISISWLPSTDNQYVSKYEVYRNGSKIGETDRIKFTDNTGLTPNTAYTYTVKAVDGAGLRSSSSDALVVAFGFPT